MKPTLLALDTSTEQMALALLWPGGSVTHVEAGGAAASSRLIPAALRLLQRAGLTLEGLDGVAFGAGPGAFTGIRTACAVAQGLAYGIGRPVLALDSLMLVAVDAAARHPVGGTIWVAMDARMDEVYAGAYALDPAGWRVLSAPMLYTVPALAARWVELAPAWVAGSAIAAFRGRLPLARAQLVTDVHDRGAALAALTALTWATSTPVDPALAAPLYLRDKVALTTEERARQMAGRGSRPG